LKNGTRNIAAAVRARLLHLARKRGEEFQFVLMHFVLERVLYRLSLSNRSGDFVLKGPMRGGEVLEFSRTYEAPLIRPIR
jgi:hypothetical protein